MTQSWYPHSGCRPSPILSACAWSTCDSSSASPYILSSGMTCSASSSSPGFSYLTGVSESEINKFLNFCDAESAGGIGVLGRLRSDAYDGGVVACCGALAVEGRYPGEGGGNCDGAAVPGGAAAAAALRFDDEARSTGDGDAFRDRERSSSFSRLVLSKPSNCCVKPFAHCSS